MLLFENYLNLVMAFAIHTQKKHFILMVLALLITIALFIKLFSIILTQTQPAGKFTETGKENNQQRINRIITQYNLSLIHI